MVYLAVGQSPEMLDEPGFGAFDGPATIFLENHRRVQPNHYHLIAPPYILFSKHRPHHLDNFLRRVIDMLLQVQVMGFLTHADIGKLINILGSTFDRFFVSS